MDDFEEELAGPWVENEYCSVNGLGREVALVRLMNRNAVDVCVVDEPGNLVREELSVILRV